MDTTVFLYFLFYFIIIIIFIIFLVGIYGNAPANQSSNVEVYDLAIFGTTITRNSSDVSSGFGGSLAGSPFLKINNKNKYILFSNKMLI